MTKRGMLLNLLEEFGRVERGESTDSYKLALQFGIDIAARALIRTVDLEIQWGEACRFVMRNKGYVGQTAVDIINRKGN